MIFIHYNEKELQVTKQNSLHIHEINLNTFLTTESNTIEEQNTY